MGYGFLGSLGEGSVLLGMGDLRRELGLGIVMVNGIFIGILFLLIV